MLILGTCKIQPRIHRSKYRGPAVNAILQILAKACYLTLIDARSGYPKLRLDIKLLYLNIFDVNVSGADSGDCYLERD